jgi:hypothetical protein
MPALLFGGVSNKPTNRTAWGGCKWGDVVKIGGRAATPSSSTLSVVPCGCAYVCEREREGGGGGGGAGPSNKTQHIHSFIVFFVSDTDRRRSLQEVQPDPSVQVQVSDSPDAAQCSGIVSGLDVHFDRVPVLSIQRYVTEFMVSDLKCSL